MLKVSDAELENLSKSTPGFPLLGGMLVLSGSLLFVAKGDPMGLLVAFYGGFLIWLPLTAQLMLANRSLDRIKENLEARMEEGGRK